MTTPTTQREADEQFYDELRKRMESLAKWNDVASRDSLIAHVRAAIDQSTRQAAPEAPTLPVAVKDALRRCGADTDYHGKMLFTVPQFDHFVSMITPATHQATQQAGAPVAWIATDLDGRAGVGFTKDEAKRQAGEGCTEFIPLFDLGATPAATTESTGYSKEWCERMARLESEFDGNIEAGATTASASIDEAEIDRLARKHNLDGSMLVGHRHDYWRAFAADILHAAQAAHAGAAPVWRPIAEAPRDGTRFWYLQPITVVSVTAPARIQYNVMEVWRARTLPETSGYWTNYATSIPDHAMLAGWFLLCNGGEVDAARRCCAQREDKPSSNSIASNAAEQGEKNV